LARKPRQEADQDEVILALQCAFEWLSRDFAITESDLSLRNQIADAVIECANEGLCEPSDIRKRAHIVLRLRSH
jgi:hypothetical protein